MSKGNKGTAIRRPSRPNRGHRPYKPIPTVTEQFRAKEKIDEKVKEYRLIQIMKNIGSRLRGLFRRKKKRNIKTFKSSAHWVSEKASQWEVDRGRHKAKVKARNRRNRKLARLLHQAERRRA